MSKILSIRPYIYGDESEIVNLLKIGFPYWTRKNIDPLSLFQWRFLDAPKGYIINIGEIEEKIISVYCMPITNFKVGTNTLLSTLLAFAVTDSNYRGKGYFNLIEDYSKQERIKKGVKFDYSTVESQILISVYKRRKKKSFPYHFAHLLRVRDIGKHLNELKVKNKILTQIAYSTLKIFNNLTPHFSQKSKNPPDYTIINVASFGPEINKFWDEVKSDYEFIVEKTQNYLNWRFCDPRVGHFIVKLAVKGDLILGYIVLELKNVDSYPEGYISDLLVLNNRHDVFNSLLGDGCKYFDMKGVNAVHYLCVDRHRYAKYATEFGFVKLPFSKDTFIDYEFYNEYEDCVIKSDVPNKIHYTYSDNL